MSLFTNLISQWLVNGNGLDSIGSHDMSSVSPSGYTTDAHLGSHALIYDGINDQSVIPNHPDFSFGNGVIDSPFSVFQWVEMTDATRFRAFNKAASNSALEYNFSTTGGDALAVTLYDLRVANNLQRITTGTLTAFQGSYILIGFTYDGSGLATGLKLYVNHQLMATTDTSAGSYTAMHPISVALKIGGHFSGTFAKGLIDSTCIWSRALSDGGVAEGNTVGAGSDIDLLWNGGAGIEITEGAVGHRRKVVQTRQLRH